MGYRLNKVLDFDGKRAEFTQLNCRVPVASKDWLANYGKRKGISMNLAMAYAIYLLYEFENRDENWARLRKTK